MKDVLEHEIRTSNRVAAINILHVRRPIRPIRNIVDPLLLIQQFMTCQNTRKEEIRVLMDILMLTTALKGNHLTLDE